MSKRYKRNCDCCGIFYNRKGAYRFCSINCYKGYRKENGQTNETKQKIKTTLKERVKQGIQPHIFKKGQSFANITKEKHYLWKGGVSSKYYQRLIRDRVIILDNCSYCKGTKNVVAHHVNLNRRDNRLENIIPVCRSCHRKLHHQLKLKRIKKE